MNRCLLLIPLLLFALGCSSARVVSSEQLPVYGTDPLVHTIYLGSDAQFHHFALQNGKAVSKALVRRDDANIIPEPFGIDSGFHAFVQSVNDAEIELVVLRRVR